MTVGLAQMIIKLWFFIGRCVDWAKILKVESVC